MKTYLASLWHRRSDGLWQQLRGDIAWAWLKWKVRVKYRLTRDPQILRHWKWVLCFQCEDSRLALEIREMISELESL